jgi:acyl-CoA synthetase (AMP-forming)/AMP-acid ligase II
VGRSVEGDEEIVAFVQAQPDSRLTAVDLAEYAALHLAQYKRPSQILLVSAMPVTPTGKILKGELSKIAEESQSGNEDLCVIDSTSKASNVQIGNTRMIG